MNPLTKIVTTNGTSGIGKRKGWRDWFLIKYTGELTSDRGRLSVNDVYFPAKYVGKRIRLKVEIIE